MSLDTLWQLHKRFLVGVAIGLTVFLIGLAIIGSTAGSDLARHSSAIGKHKRSLTSPVYNRAQLNALNTRLNEIDERVETLAKAALPPLREEYDLAGKTSPTQHYIELTGSLRNELIGWALRRDVEIDENLGEIEKKIVQILDQKIRPAVAKDGGDIKFKEFKDGVVKVQLQGSCSGCPSSTMTLKQGVQNLLCHYLPEVKEVVAV